MDMIQIIFVQGWNAHNAFPGIIDDSDMLHRMITLGSVLVAIVSLSLWAAEEHSGHAPGMDHNAMGVSNAQPKEGGQAAFAALIEVVALLEQDTNTDWSTVDIDGLRSHLRT